MERSGSRLLLKVLSGPHAGAEMLLAPGRHTVGSDDSCDLVLVDPSIASQHAVLIVDAGSCTIESVDDAPVVVGGSRTSRTSLKSFQVVTVGATHIATGPANDAWPALALTDDQVATRSEPVPAMTAQTPPPPTPVEAPPTSPPVADLSPMARKSRQRPGEAAGFGAAAVVLMAFLWFLFRGNGGDPVVAVADPTAVEQQLRGLLQEYSADSALTIESPEGVLTVSGYVATPDVRKKLRKAVEALSPAVDVRVSDTETLAQSAQRILAMYRLDLQATAGAPGEVVVTGELADPAPWHQTKPKIVKDVPRIAKLSDRVNQPAEPEPEPAPVATTAEPVTAPIVERPPQREPAKAGPAPPSVALAIQSVTVGSRRWIVLSSGERVFVGGQLASGHVVKEIESDHVVVAREGQQTMVMIGGR